MQSKHLLRWLFAITGAVTIITTALALAGAEPQHRSSALVIDASERSVPDIAPSPRQDMRPNTPAKPARRFDTRQIYMRPPYDLRRKQVALTCGYHDSCRRYEHRLPHYRAGDGLDWNDDHGTLPETKDVYFTASAHAATSSRIATVRFEYHPSGRDHGYPCMTLVAKVYSLPERVLLFRVMYEHVAPLRGLRGFDIVAQAHAFDPQQPPNVVRRIGIMREDRCAFFTRGQTHAHVEPQSHARFVSYARNMMRNSFGVRVVPDVNGCDTACSGPVFPGPRWSAPYWSLWTFRWSWVTDARTGRLRR